jgi:hypothetical protein
MEDGICMIPGDIPDRFYCAIGKIVYCYSSLDAAFVYLLSELFYDSNAATLLVRGESTDWLTKKLLALLGDRIGLLTEDEATKLTRSVEEARRYMPTRNMLVHAEWWVYDTVSESLQGVMHRRDVGEKEHEITLEQIEQTADKITEMWRDVNSICSRLDERALHRLARRGLRT